jgi:hypothetical protein
MDVDIAISGSDTLNVARNGPSAADVLILAGGVMATSPQRVPMAIIPSHCHRIEPPYP